MLGCLTLKTMTSLPFTCGSDLWIFSKEPQWKNTNMQLLFSKNSGMEERSFLIAGFMEIWKASNEDVKYSGSPQILAANGDFHIARSKEHDVALLVSEEPANAFVFLTTECWGLKHSCRRSHTEFTNCNGKNKTVHQPPLQGCWDSQRARQED